MAADYRDAATRHWKDAEILFEKGRLANADHLYGVSAECALKAVMQGLGMKVIPSTGHPEDRAHRVHIDKLWDEFSAFAKGKNGAKYLPPMSSAQNPFSDWNVSQRYDNELSFKSATVDSHKDATKIVMNVLNTAILDGVVP